MPFYDRHPLFRFAHDDHPTIEVADSDTEMRAVESQEFDPNVEYVPVYQKRKPAVKKEPEEEDYYEEYE